MRKSGVSLMVLGVILLIIALLLDTTVALDMTVASGGFDLGRMHNLGLLQNRELLTIVGAAAFTSGAILFATASLREQLEDMRLLLGRTVDAVRHTASPREQYVNVTAGSDPEGAWSRLAILAASRGWAAARNERGLTVTHRRAGVEETFATPEDGFRFFQSASA